MKLLEGVLDGTPYTIIIESGLWIFSRGAHRHATSGPASLLDHLLAQGWELPHSDESWLCDLAFQGSDVVKHLLDEKGHWDLVTADDINDALKQGIADTERQEAIRTLLLGRIDKQLEDTP